MCCKHYKKTLEESDRYYVDCQKYNNCCLCLVENEGPLTQEEVAKYLGISKMRVSQVQNTAQEKFERRIKKILD